MRTQKFDMVLRHAFNQCIAVASVRSYASAIASTPVLMSMSPRFRQAAVSPARSGAVTPERSGPGAAASPSATRSPTAYGTPMRAGSPRSVRSGGNSSPFVRSGYANVNTSAAARRITSHGSPVVHQYTVNAIEADSKLQALLSRPSDTGLSPRGGGTPTGRWPRPGSDAVGVKLAQGSPSTILGGTSPRTVPQRRIGTNRDAGSEAINRPSGGSSRVLSSRESSSVGPPAYTPRVVAVGGQFLDYTSSGSGNTGVHAQQPSQLELPLRSNSNAVPAALTIIGGAAPSSPIADAVRAQRARGSPAAEARRRMADPYSPQFNLVEYSSLELGQSKTYRQLNAARESYRRDVSDLIHVSAAT